jgi:hypothetical protein
VAFTSLEAVLLAELTICITEGGLTEIVPVTTSDMPGTDTIAAARELVKEVEELDNPVLNEEIEDVDALLSKLTVDCTVTDPAESSMDTWLAVTVVPSELSWDATDDAHDTLKRFSSSASDVREA